MIVQDLRLENLQENHRPDPWEQWKAVHPQEAAGLNTAANQMMRELITKDQDYSSALEKVQTWLETKKRELMSSTEFEQSEEIAPFDFDKLSKKVVLE